MNFRFLDKNDILTFKELRLLSLQESPLAFSESYEDELKKMDVQFELELNIIGIPAESFVLGVFSKLNELIGFVKFQRDTRSKARHKATLHALYIKPQYRKQSIGKTLMTELFKIIESLKGVEQIHLWVLISDTSVMNFYEKCDFQTHGAIVKNDLKIGDRYVDAMYMVKYL
jgi:ribosomal protein S18 acetylase RimI-like enzyme